MTCDRYDGTTTVEWAAAWWSGWLLAPDTELPAVTSVADLHPLPRFMPGDGVIMADSVARFVRVLTAWGRACLCQQQRTMNLYTWEGWPTAQPATPLREALVAAGLLEPPIEDRVLACLPLGGTLIHPEWVYVTVWADGSGPCNIVWRPPRCLGR